MPGSVTVKVHFVDCGGDHGHDGAVDDYVGGGFIPANVVACELVVVAIEFVVVAVIVVAVVVVVAAGVVDEHGDDDIMQSLLEKYEDEGDAVHESKARGTR